MDDKLLTINEISNIFGRKKSSIYKWVKDGSFPKPVMSGRWSAVHIQRYLSHLRGDDND